MQTGKREIEAMRISSAEGRTGTGISPRLKKKRAPGVVPEKKKRLARQGDQNTAEERKDTR